VKDKNIVLIGFMGTGKTTIGKIIAKELRIPFIDTDDYIEEKLNMNIKDIFKLKGENFFRKIEAEVVSEVSRKKRHVISTGGGVILNTQNVINLKEYGTIFLLNGEVKTIISNLQGSIKDRPLLENEDWRKRVSDLLNERRKKYIESADIIITIDNKSPKKIAEEIIIHNR